MKITTNQLAGTLLGVLLAHAAQAETERFEFDKSHADITFRVSHLGYSSTHGRFNDFDGQLMLNIQDLAKSSVEVKIQTASVETSWPKRNTHLKSADFFNVDAFPTMSFQSSEIAMETPTTGKLAGELTLLDQTHPITLDLTINKIAPHPRNGIMTAGITATGVIQRSIWGMDKFAPGIADDIELRLDMEATQAQ